MKRFEDETNLVIESGINFYYQLGMLTYEEAMEKLNAISSKQEISPNVPNPA